MLTLVVAPMMTGLAIVALAGGPPQVARTAPLGFIQDMISAAPDGGTVSIPAGTYSESLTIDKNLTLTGASMDTTILRPSMAGQRVITVTAGHSLRLESLQITGGQAGADAGGGVYVMSGTLTLVSSRIHHNSAAYGGGVFQGGAGGMLTSIGSLFQDNTATLHGGGIYVAGSAVLTDTTLSANTAGFHGGGIHVNGSSTLLYSGIITGNHANGGNGGGVNLNDALSIVGTQFSNNTSTDLGGALTQWNPGKTVTIVGATFSGNTAVNKAGGAYIRSYLTITDTTFISNTVNSGGTGNTYGGGLYAGNGLDGSGLTLTSNRAQCTGCSWTDGGGIYITRDAVGTSTIVRSTFDDNRAWFGGGIQSGSPDRLALTDSTFRNHSFGCTGTECNGYGSAVYATRLDGDRLLFENNRAVNRGGAICGDILNLSNSRLLGNSAGYGSGVHAYDVFSGTNLLLSGNTAWVGGALYVSGGQLYLRHTTIAQPNRAAHSAIMADHTSYVWVRNSIISGYAEGFKVEGTTTLDEDYNLFWNNGTNITPTHSIGTHDITGQDPAFYNPAGGDFHLRTTSPAIGAGTDLGVTDDLDGRARTARWDIGAYQYRPTLYLPLVVR